MHTPWLQFIQSFTRNWRQGEHVTIIGATGSGKSLLAMELVKRRKFYILFLTKGRDKTLDHFIRENDVEVIEKWPHSGFDDKIALWPRFKDISSFQTQHTVFRQAINGYIKNGRKIDGVYAEGGWTILVDEVMYFIDELSLKDELRMLWTQGRSNDLSLVASSQRPREVPQLMLNQWSHLFVFQTSDKYEIDRLAGIGGNLSAIIKREVPQLKRHHFLYINRQIGNYAISMAERN